MRATLPARPARPARLVRHAEPADASDAALQTWLSVVRAYHLCEAVLSQRLLALNLKLAEHEVLVNLLRLPGLTQQQLAARCFVAKSGISVLVGRMVSSGWLQRGADAADARVWRLQLTPAGRALALRAQAVQAGVVAAMAEGSAAEEQRRVRASMERASATLQRLMEDGGR